jgi:ABC-2 type transport system ATP-binding protein
MSLQIDGVSKRYPQPPWFLRPVMRTAHSGTVEALRNVTFDVAKGEIVGLVGPNGAGKTTLIKIISTLLTPTSGSVHVDGVDLAGSPAEARTRLGLVLTDDRTSYWRLDGRSNLNFFGVLAGLPPAAARARADELLGLLGLADRDKRVMGYSSGMRSALNIARAVIAEPALIVLDEPTRSLDPLASARVGDLLRGEAAQGRSVLLSSHRMEEVATLCDRVVVLVGGEVRFVGRPADVADGPTANGLLALLERESSTV